MYNKIVLIFVSLGIVFNSIAQQQNKIWLFGKGDKGIEFNQLTNEPKVITGKYVPYGNEGCGVATHPVSGKLLFYSDGVIVVDAKNKLMPNGTGLLGHSSSAQNSWICSVPGECNKYYLFSSAAAYEENPNGGLYYSIIDMNLPGNGTISAPLGDVVSGKKNIVISSNGSEALTLIKSSTYGEYWLLHVMINTTSIKIYKINSSGVNLFNTYNGSITFNDPRNIRYSESSNRFSITSIEERDPVVVGKFDPSSGTITSVTDLPGTPFTTNSQIYYGCYDSEWSSDGTKLYIGKYRWYLGGAGRIYQYDFSIPASIPKMIYDVQGDASNGVLGMKLGPDKKIYVLYNSPSTGFRYIGRIENPNDEASSVVFNPKALDMGAGYSSSAKFPEFLGVENRKPVANIDDYTANCFASGKENDFDVLGNDSDPENNSLTVSIIKTYKGSATRNADNSIHFKPLNGYFGIDTIWYQICDNACFSLCDTSYALVCIALCNNTPPVAVKDSTKCIMDTTSRLLINVLKNDLDFDGDAMYLDSPVALHGSVKIYNDSVLSYSPKLSFSGIDTISYKLCEKSCNNTCVNTVLEICIENLSLFIPNLITPNGDDRNDVFYVRGLYPGTRLRIYNSWGSMVFEKEDYKNDWGMNHTVSDGIYFYELTDDVRNQKYKGWLHVLSSSTYSQK
ncbi:MAG: gliding motility-associated C-terminal domain-containing protein [Sporocytophaga sp.]|uniref:Ig-like domain-containing protein n=1 Tax=Sporocytophaga sp. TaxID=2231183 RepID=UPI001B055E4B|nr:Ig-like domain-containing protein [Sporocytophaga sp.]MBO9703505.1 gliding motility-associated C-terminal domain-containing protein [Sporocytophaga sp.]